MQRATAVTAYPTRNREMFAAAALRGLLLPGLILGLLPIIIIRPGPWERVG